MTVKHPLILWAQRSPHVYLAVEVEDMKVEEMKVSEDSFKLKGTKNGEVYEADIQLFAKVKGEESRQIATDRRIELVIPKETTEWWPRLLKEKTKVQWIKVDFDKWKDEDEENEECDPGFGGGGDFGGMDFSQFGGMPGMGGMGMPGMGGKPGGFDMNDLDLGDEGDDDDEDIGELEDIENPEGTKTGEAPNKLAENAAAEKA